MLLFDVEPLQLPSEQAQINATCSVSLSRLSTGSSTWSRRGCELQEVPRMPCDLLCGSGLLGG
jgi:hypothetical protein